MKAAKQLFFALSVALPLGIATAQTELEVPDFYAEPGLNSNRDYLNQSANEHIDPFSGTLQHHYIDLVVPGNGGLDIKIQRSYTSPQQSLGESSPWGTNWSMHFGRVIKRDAAICLSPNPLNQNDNPRFELPDGSSNVLYVYPKNVASDPDYITKDRWRADCTGSLVPFGDIGGYRITSPEGTVYEMDEVSSASSSEYINGNVVIHSYQLWYPSRITDRNGKSLQFFYNRIPETNALLLSSVRANDGRVVTFEYANMGNFVYVLTKVNANGQTWRYVYKPVFGSQNNSAGQNRFYLSEVRSPGDANALVWKYDYYPWDGPAHHNRYALKSVTYPYGAKISYDYSPVQFDTRFFYPSWPISAKHVTGPDVWNVSWYYYYTPANSVYPPLPYDETYIAAPDQHHLKYRHHGISSTPGGETWKVGLPYEIEKYSSGNLTETTRFDWAAQPISTEFYRRTQRVNP